MWAWWHFFPFFACTKPFGCFQMPPLKAIHHSLNLFLPNLSGHSLSRLGQRLSKFSASVTINGSAILVQGAFFFRLNWELAENSNLGSEILYNGHIQDQEAEPHLERSPGGIPRSIWRVFWAGSVDFKPGIYTAAEEKREAITSLRGRGFCEGRSGRRKGPPCMATQGVWRGEAHRSLGRPSLSTHLNQQAQQGPFFEGPKALRTLPLVINAEAGQPGYRVSLQKFL